MLWSDNTKEEEEEHRPLHVLGFAIDKNKNESKKKNLLGMWLGLASVRCADCANYATKIWVRLKKQIYRPSQRSERYPTMER